jgi:uncharacterized protein (TIGR02246 family)
MNRSYITACATVLCLLIAGCAQAPPPAPPPDTRAADEKAIRDGDVAWNAAWAAKDAEKIVSQYADDAILMVPDMPSMKGKDAIRAGLKMVLADPNVFLTFKANSVDVAKSGDLAFSQGVYTMVTSDPKTKKPVTEKGTYVTNYKKQADGSWKAVQDINTPDAPAK